MSGALLELLELLELPEPPGQEGHGQGHRQQLAAVTAHRASEAIFSQNIKAPPCTRDGCHSILCRGDAFATLSQHQSIRSRLGSWFHRR